MVILILPNFFLPVHCGIWRLESRRQFSWTILVTACVCLCPRTTTASFLVLATLWPSCGTSGMASASKPSRVTRVTSTPFQWVYTKCLMHYRENAEESITVIFLAVISFFIGDPNLLPISKIWVFPIGKRKAHKWIQQTMSTSSVLPQWQCIYHGLGWLHMQDVWYSRWSRSDWLPGCRPEQRRYITGSVHVWPSHLCWLRWLQLQYLGLAKGRESG